MVSKESKRNTGELTSKIIDDAERGSVCRIGFATIMAVLAISLLVGGAGAAMPISECTTISLPGTYILTQSIINSSVVKCINIISSNVIFNGAGYTVDGMDAFNTIGVYVSSTNATALTNVTVRNLKVTDWLVGIYYNNVQNGSITNNTASSEQSGIYLRSSSNNILTNNTANLNYYQGILVSDSSYNNTLTYNIVSLNTFGISLSSSNNNILTNNIANSNNYGIHIRSSSSNILTNNTANSSIFSGIYIDSSNSNNIYNNFFNNRNNFSIWNNSTNSWNTTKTAGTNIIGGSYLGGNFWSNPSGTGFSQTCTDSDSDGICDTPYALNGNNIDDLPLAYKVSTSDVTSPASVTNLTNRTYALSYINWTWTEPKDTDFANVTVYLDGKFKINVSKGRRYYNATGLLPNTRHIISTHTVDTSGNINQTWRNHTSRTRPDAVPPRSITNLKNRSYALNYINWTWSDPSDYDFTKVMVYIDGKFKTNVSKGVRYYNATGLLPNTRHTISTHTVDTSGNINKSWRNYTARTKSDATPPRSITNLINRSYAQNYINWTWTDPLDSDFSRVMVYINGVFKKNITKGTRYYNATNLIQNTSYKISTHTVDTSGNINKTWVNHTARTTKDIIPSVDVTAEPSKIHSVVTNTTATITWVTNNFSDSLVKYGKSPGNYTFIRYINESATFHSVILINLSPDTNYYFVVNSTDVAGSTQGRERIFWTPYDSFQGNLNITNIEIKQLTDYEEKASSPIWIEDKIFYASNRTGNMDIWVMDKDGSNKTRITNSTASEVPSDTWVSWENNSKVYKVLYISRTNGSSSIWLTNGDGSNKSQLINDSYENLNPVLVYVPMPVIFGMQPSGTINNNVPLINASYYSNYGNISKVNISVDGVDVTSIANISKSNLSYVPVEPLNTGKHNFTVTVETDKYTKGSGYQSFNIRYIYNPLPSCTVLTNTPTISANISVGYGSTSSVVITVDGINVTSNATIHPSYIEYVPIVPLSDGPHSVSLEVKTTRGFSDTENWTFYVNTPSLCIGGISVGGGGRAVLQKIMFASNRSGNFDIWIMNLDGSGLQQKTSDLSNEFSPAWVEPKVVYISDRSGNKDIWSMDIGGSNKKQLTSSIPDENMPSWNYIGGIIYTAGKDGVSNLKAMNTDGTGKMKITNSSTYMVYPARSSDTPYSPGSTGILYSSATEEESSIYLMNFEERGPKVKFWKLGEGYSLQVVSIDTRSTPAQAWFKLQKNGTTREDRVVRVGQAFSLFDKGRVILNAVLSRIGDSDPDYYFEAELVNATQYSSIDGSRLFTNETKILVNKILLNGNT